MNHRQKLQEAVAGLRRDPAEGLRLLRMGLATFRFRYLLRVAGAGCVFGTNNRIINAANVRIGRECLFQDSIYIRAGVKGRVEIGDRVALNSFVQIYGHGGVSLGDETQLGPGTIVTTTGHDYVDERLTAVFTPITIGRRVWVGANTTIIGGVTIGDGAVIGAGAVVIRDIPPHSVAVGVPARVVRRLDDEANVAGGPSALRRRRKESRPDSDQGALARDERSARVVAPIASRSFKRET